MQLNLLKNTFLCSRKKREIFCDTLTAISSSFPSRNIQHDFRTCVKMSDVTFCDSNKDSKDNLFNAGIKNISHFRIFTVIWIILISNLSFVQRDTQNFMSVVNFHSRYKGVILILTSVTTHQIVTKERPYFSWKYLGMQFCQFSKLDDLDELCGWN